MDTDAPPELLSAFQALSKRASEAAQLDADGARAAYPVSFQPSLSYDPSTAQFFDTIQASALALSEPEVIGYREHGFVISKRREFPTFLRGLAEIYSEHLPVYVTADALLEAVHSSYDTILLQIEQQALIPALRKLLTGMRSRLAESRADEGTRADTDLYLAVALSLLEGKTVDPVAGAQRSEIVKFFEKASKASGVDKVRLFNVERDEDFSQFKPRGHYTDMAELQQYFRSMMWLGRIDLRLLETQSDGTQVFRPDQYAAMLLMYELAAPDLALFESIDKTVQTFVGESDYMVLSEVEQLVADLGGMANARMASEQEVAQAILTGGYGEQQIASHLMVNDGTVETLPLNRSFALLGQRYVVDSHVFSEVVYDRLPAKRMMPTPLDAAFAALGNNQALALHPELTSFDALPGALARMRVLVDAHDESFWGANLYNTWLGALRALSPKPDLSDPGSLGLPEVAGTAAWGRRLLNTQLGSWAELRHDTLLYAKQSYTGIPGCEYPDAYVDPYPAFYRALHKYAAEGSRIAAMWTGTAPALAHSVGDYFARLGEATSILADMPGRQLRGEPFEPAQLAFINDAVRVEQDAAGCATIEVPDGWYAHLFFEPAKSIEFDATIADVHTQPADAGGNIVGKVLHVGTGYPRLMVASIDTCEGAPRAYAGVVYAYHEHVTENFERLTDEEWQTRFVQGAKRPEDVDWLDGVLR